MLSRFIKILLLCAVLFPAQSFAAEAFKLRHALSLYDDGKGGSLRQPEGVAWDGKSSLLVADAGNGRLLRYFIQGTNVTSVAEIKPPELTFPIRVKVNSKGEIFVLDGRQRRILRLSPEGTFKGYLDPEGLPLPASWVAKSFDIGTDDTICILDIFSGRVLVLNSEGKYEHQIGFPEDYGFLSDLALDTKGTIFLIDSVRSEVFSAARDSNAFSPLTKKMKEYMNFPTTLAAEGNNLYVVDRNGGGIVILGRDGSFKGRRLRMGWKEGELRYPAGICLNGSKKLFVADRGNNRVQMYMIEKE